jgi:DNA-binding NarL/FixJ family response regulator
MNVRVMVVADDPLARAGLAVLLAELPGLTMVGQAAAGDDLQAAVDAYRPDVVLWDMGWDAGDGALRLADFAEGSLKHPVVALLAADAPPRAAWTAGARGILRRDASLEQIAAAIAAAAQGLVVLEPAISLGLSSEGGTVEGEQTAASALVEPLTPRESEVLALLAEGLPNKTIAHRLGISEHTVKFHVNAILGKLGVESRTEAVVRATRLGLIFL